VLLLCQRALDCVRGLRLGWGTWCEPLILGPAVLVGQQSWVGHFLLEPNDSELGESTGWYA
jgi:hypothetical protein